MRFVLVIDDDPAVLNAVRRTLRDLPVRLVCLGSAEEALEVMTVRLPDAVVSDHRLPGIFGLDLLLEVRTRWPQVRTLLHTGDPLARRRAEQLRLPTVEKGAQPGTLLATLRSLLES